MKKNNNGSYPFLLALNNNNINIIKLILKYAKENNLGIWSKKEEEPIEEEVVKEEKKKDFFSMIGDFFGNLFKSIGEFFSDLFEDITNE